MKKVVLMLMLVVSVVCFSDWEVITSGKDREWETNHGHPGVALLLDQVDGKYDIYRFTMKQGYWLSPGDLMNKKDLDLKERKFHYHEVLVYKGKKCLNLTEAEAKKILKEIEFKEMEGLY